MLTQQMDVLASMFHDLKVTSDALTDAVEDVEMTVAQEEKYGEFNYRLSQISDSFYKAIQNLDLNAKTGSATQFSEAISAYKEKKDAFLPGKFLREFQKFKKDNPVVSLYTVYTLQENVTLCIGNWSSSLYFLMFSFSSISSILCSFYFLIRVILYLMVSAPNW
jgi:hypothetical protein